MRRHHESVTSAIVPALAMLVPTAGVIVARLISILGAPPPPPSTKGDP
ncbi:MAG TPA: hypothetical protein VFP85_03985 [Vicinamibacterales bacterium]|nr:hypothetical protein [Vicinamibacterales bacterium]